MNDKIKVQPMFSRNGNAVANQYIIVVNDSRYFQSYNTIICKIINGIVELDRQSWDYSRTTSKYRNQFLGETTQETQLKIDKGIYKLTNLN